MVVEKNTGKIIAIMADDALQTDTEYEIVTRPCVSEPGDSMIAHTGDFFFYENTPEELYKVISADNSFFQMVRVTLDNDDNLTFNGDKTRTYPNNKYIGTLQDYGLVKL